MEKAYLSPSRMEKTLHSIKYEGNLYKRGRGKKLSFIKPWRIRRFVLDTKTCDFTYFKDVEGSNSVKKGHLDVSHAKTEKVDKEESGKDHSFRITLDNEEMYLACSNDKDIDMWVDALNYCSKKNMLSPRRRSSSKPDRAFFLDSTPDKGLANLDEDDTEEEVDMSDVRIGFEKCALDSTEDEGADDTSGSSPPLSSHLSIKIVSSDGSAIAIPTPDFSSVLRGLPDMPIEVDEEQAHMGFESAGDVGEDSHLNPSDEEFPPLEPRFQDILLKASDFVIDTALGVCGTGAFGTVYRAVRVRDGEVFALKFFGYAKRDPQNLDILETEIDVMLKLKGSEVFAQIEGFFYDTYEGLIPNKKFIDSYPVIVMEFLEQDLLSFLATSSSTVIAQSLPRVFRELVQGLDCLHQRGFLHRDLKVDNVMISSDHKVKLIDFGFLCALEEGEEEFLGPQTGTIGYFAPESIPLSGYSVFSAKSDIWQAGVVLYTLICGKMPFNISSFNIRKAKYPPLVCPPWEPRPAAAIDLVSHLLQLNPQDRFTATEILAHEWLQESPAVPADPPRKSQQESSARDYHASINSLIQRRNVKKVLQTIQDDAEGVFDRSYKAESIMDAVEITGGKTYFMIRMGSLKSLILQNISTGFNLNDSLNYTEFCHLMAKNALLELTNAEVFSRFCHEHGYFNPKEGEVAASSLTCSVQIKELLLTLIALVGVPDQDDDALACFLKFDTNCTGYLDKDAIIHIFRGLLEDEAALVAAGAGAAAGATSEVVDSELDDIEAELKEIEGVFSCVEVKEGKPGIDFLEFKLFHDSVMKISTRMSTRLSMRSMTIVSMAVGKFTDSLHSIRFKKQNGMAKTVKGESRSGNYRSKKPPKSDWAKTL